MTSSTVSYSSVTGAADASGGGVYAKGDLSLNSSTISNNTAAAGSGTGRGGGAYVGGNLNISSGGKYTLLSQNKVSSVSASALGGGAFTVGDFYTQKGAAVLTNSATAPAGNAAGGGVYARGALTLKTSFVSYNTANGAGSVGAGAYVLGNFVNLVYERQVQQSLRGGVWRRIEFEGGNQHDSLVDDSQQYVVLERWWRRSFREG